jgi:hypothetical protein
VPELAEKDCLDYQAGGWAGGGEVRPPPSGNGRSFLRCHAHWSARLEKQQEINDRYPEQAPADFDPAYAGESWDEPQ